MLRLRQRTRHLIYSALAGAVTTGILAGTWIGSLQNQSQRQQEAREARYRAEINRLKQEQAGKRIQGWIPVRDIDAGEKMGASDLKLIELPSDRTPADYVVSKEQIEGKIAKVSLRKSTLITDSLLYEEEPAADDLRNREISFVKIPFVLKTKDVVDVRIQFPTGQDYIVLSKKKVKDLKSSTMTLTLSEAEILSLSSAVVDAYLHKASIYALTYVEPELQTSAIPTYPANQEVLKLIAKDPNILKRAEHGLSITSRALLEKDLSALTPQTASEFEGKQSEYYEASREAGTAAAPGSNKSGDQPVVANNKEEIR
ncbi:SAF domain-containing protein [Paenibacillus tuaregi]|uniref:SAF domain-containing protein n=1 Tax=Paenibacillus tuaregi TaxID=1816681 RepID=UPI000838814E|nr:SAF domain-containing protein [Paenibacillus tuaregi]